MVASVATGKEGVKPSQYLCAVTAGVSFADLQGPFEGYDSTATEVHLLGKTVQPFLYNMYNMVLNLQLRTRREVDRLVEFMLTNSELPSCACVVRRLEYLATYSFLGGVPMTGYCLKCRTSREIQSPQAVTLKNGRPATQGICPTCGTKMSRIGKVE